jgi:hypothetical protein
MSRNRNMASEVSITDWMRMVDKRMTWQERSGKGPLVGAEDPLVGALGVATRSAIPEDMPVGQRVYIEDEDVYCTTPC